MNETDEIRPRLAALLYGERGGGDLMLESIARRLVAEGRVLAGLVQINARRPDRCRCDMILEDLASGRRLPISQDLGRTERGCRLDYGALDEAATLARAGLTARTDLMLLSKFGKRESEGGGFRQAIEAAVSLDVPVLIGLSRDHVAAWERFTGGLAETFATEAAVRIWLRAAVRPRLGVAA